MRLGCGWHVQVQEGDYQMFNLLILRSILSLQSGCFCLLCLRSSSLFSLIQQFLINRLPGENRMRLFVLVFTLGREENFVVTALFLPQPLLWCWERLTEAIHKFNHPQKGMESSLERPEHILWKLLAYDHNANKHSKEDQRKHLNIIQEIQIISLLSNYRSIWGPAFAFIQCLV